MPNNVPVPQKMCSYSKWSLGQKHDFRRLPSPQSILTLIRGSDSNKGLRLCFDDHVAERLDKIPLYPSLTQKQLRSPGLGIESNMRTASKRRLFPTCQQLVETFFWRASQIMCHRHYFIARDSNGSKNHLGQKASQRVNRNSLSVFDPHSSLLCSVQ